MKIPPELIQQLAAAERVVVLTGAGVSAESGVPTFRDAQSGLWAKFRLEELATPEAFQRNPRLVWEWYAWRRQLVAKAEPNAGHLALAELERRVPRFTLITQNIDDLHQRAGSRNIVQLHGSIARTKCSNEDARVADWPDTSDVPPKCPRCGALLRPDVVWFGEAMPSRETAAAFEASAQSEVFVSIGTSSVVQPAAEMPLHALRHGATLIEINPEPTPLTPRAHFVIGGTSATVVPQLVEMLSATSRPARPAR